MGKLEIIQELLYCIMDIVTLGIYGATLVLTVLAIRYHKVIVNYIKSITYDKDR